MQLLVCVPALVLALLGYALIALLLGRTSAARRHLALRGLLVASCALPLVSPLLLFVPKVPVVAVSAETVRAAPAWTPDAVLPEDGWRVRGTVLDVTPEERQSGFDASAAWNAANLLTILLMSVATVRAGRRLAALKAGAERAGDFEGIPVLVATDPRLAVPVTFGGRIVLPAASAGWPEARRTAALTHEAAHVQRGDWAWTIAARAACTLYWYSPGLWLVARALRATAEEAADDAVLAAGVRPSEYARELLAVSRALGSPDRVALAMVGRGGLRGRVAAVLAPRRDRRRATWAFGVAAGLVLAGVALVSASLGVRMRRLTLAPPPGARSVEAGEPVRRGSTTVWLDSVFSADAERVVGWDPSGGATKSTLEAHASLIPGRVDRYYSFQLLASRRDPNDDLTVRLPRSAGVTMTNVSKLERSGPLRVTTIWTPEEGGAFSTDLAVGVAGGPWRSEGPVSFWPMTITGERGGLSHVSFNLSRATDDSEWRAEVRTTTGRRVVTNVARYGTAFAYVSLRLHPGERIESVEIEARAYRWALFRDVPLVPRPAARRTARRPVLRRDRTVAGGVMVVEGVR